MKLHCNPISPYARKAMILWRLKGLDIEEIPAKVDGTRGYTGGANPLGKIPALETLDHGVLYDSPVICEYLDTLKDTLLPASGPERWAQLRLHALGDGISDAVYNYRYEIVRDEALHCEEMINRHETAMETALAELEGYTDHLGAPWTYGNIAIICALGYMGYRAGHMNWRERAPRLAAWHDQFVSEPVYQATHAYP